MYYFFGDVGGVGCIDDGGEIVWFRVSGFGEWFLFGDDVGLYWYFVVYFVWC